LIHYGCEKKEDGKRNMSGFEAITEPEDNLPYSGAWDAGVGDGVVFVRYLLLMRLNFKSAAIFSDRTAERLKMNCIFSVFLFMGLPQSLFCKGFAGMGF
jgi:hypothetical protein